MSFIYSDYFFFIITSRLDKSKRVWIFSTGN